MGAPADREHSGCTGVVLRAADRIASTGRLPAAPDAVVEEEPLEILVDDEPVGVTMRTPGDDRELALGFLHAEGIVRALRDVGDVAVCVDREGNRNTVRVRSAPGTVLDSDRSFEGRRRFPVTSACGACGRRTIGDLIERCGVVEGGPVLASRAIERSLERMRAGQARFDRTGGIHAAAAFAEDGTLLELREDVGRHNAVDKVVGALLMAGRLERAALLTVSGRAGFEIVQKAAAARIAVVASVSATSSLAVDLAEASGVTLAAFVRGGGMSVYAHPRRIAPPPLVGVFVGGRSSRMGGKPKGLLPLPSGETIVERTVRLVEGMGLRCALVGATPAYRERFPHVPVVEDAPGRDGPMAGLEALLRTAAGGPAIALACDMPYVEAALLERLIAFEAGCEVVAPREEDGRWQPFFARYDAGRTLERIRAAGAPRLQALFAGDRTLPLPLSPAERASLRDWDTPEDVDAFRKDAP